MKIDFSAPITDFKHRPFNERGELWRLRGSGETPQEGDDVMTLGFVCHMALNAGVGEERTFAGAMERYRLMEKVYGAGGAQEITAAQIAKMQELIGKFWAPVIIGPAAALLEPAPAPGGAAAA